MPATQEISEIHFVLFYTGFSLNDPILFGEE